MQNFCNQHLAPLDLGSYNAWDVYFKQFSDCTVDEVYHSYKVIIVPMTASGSRAIFSHDYFSKHILDKESQLFFLLFYDLTIH